MRTTASSRALFEAWESATATHNVAAAGEEKRAAKVGLRSALQDLESRGLHPVRLQQWEDDR